MEPGAPRPTLELPSWPDVSRSGSPALWMFREKAPGSARWSRAHHGLRETRFVG